MATSDASAGRPERRVDGGTADDGMNMAARDARFRGDGGGSGSVCESLAAQHRADTATNQVKAEKKVSKNACMHARKKTKKRKKKKKETKNDK